MVCKEEIIPWFKDLESYKRIDMMCTLLNMCLPFELRFLGTCLEELGRRDAQELRGAELRVNNPQEFLSDIQECFNGEPTDIKMRRKMALYLALLRETLNRTCINDLFKTLEQWGDRDFSKFADGDPLQELLLVYSMATNHPIFTYDQRLKCGEVLNKIKAAKQVDSPRLHQQHMAPQTLASTIQATQFPPPQIPPTAAAGYQIPSYAALQNASASTPPSPQQNAAQTLPFQMMTHYPTTPLPQIISADSLPPHMTPTTVEAITQMQALQSNMTIPADFSIPPPTTMPWALRTGFVSQQFQQITMPMESSFHQSTSSPMLSQPSSPSHSRTASPTRGLRSDGQSGGNNGGGGGSNASSGRGIGGQRGSKTSRRPSIDTTPPPQQQQQQSQIITLVENDVMSQNIKQFDDVANVDGVITLRNGYTRASSHNAISRGGKQQPYTHQGGALQHSNQSSQLNSSYPTATGLAYTFQGMNIIDLPQAMHHPPPGLVHLRGTPPGSSRGGTGTGSDSGSSVGSGEISPPETPGLGANTSTTSSGGGRQGGNRGMNRMNGRSSEKQGTQGSGTTTSNVTGTVIYPSATSGGQNFGTSDAINSSVSSSGPTLLLQTNANQLVNNVLLQSPMQTAVTTTIPQFSGPFPPYHGQHGNLATLNHRLSVTGGAQPQPTAFRHPSVTFAPAPGTITQTNEGQVVYISPMFLSHTTPPPTRSSPAIVQQTIPQNATSMLQQGGPAFPTTKVNTSSCYNCGSTAHSGRECQEASMEDVTRNTIYKLDFTAAATAQPTAPSVRQQEAPQQQQQPQLPVGPKTKPLFNPADITPAPGSADAGEIISLLSSDSSNESNSSSK